MNRDCHPISDEIFRTMHRKQDEKVGRGYLGMSEIGSLCNAKIWFGFRYASYARFDGKTLAKFADGHYSEFITSTRLSDLSNVIIETHNSEGNQFGFADLGGHFRGHADGYIRLLDYPRISPAEKLVWEHKCVGESNFKSFKKLFSKKKTNEILEVWNYKYYIQAQLYMYYSMLSKHFLTVAEAGSRGYAELITTFDYSVADLSIKRARGIIASDVVPDKIRLDLDVTDSYSECLFCTHSDVCHGKELPLPTCRSCMHSIAIIDEGLSAAWHCKMHQIDLDLDAQLTACTDHLYIPSMLSDWGTQISYSGNSVSYEVKESLKIIVNGKANSSGSKTHKMWSSFDMYFAGQFDFYTMQNDQKGYKKWIEKI